jgi:hypothetical protein
LLAKPKLVKSVNSLVCDFMVNPCPDLIAAHSEKKYLS